MAVVRRHWAMMLAVPLFLLGLLIAMMQYGSDSRKVRAQPLPEQANKNPPVVPPKAASPVDLPIYQKTQELRAELALTAQDMAAMGLSSTSAVEVLTVVKAFVATSTNALADADTAIQQVRRELQEASRRRNVGPRDEAVLTSIPLLEQKVAAAQAQRDLVIAGLVGQINVLLTPDQREMWGAAHANTATASLIGITAPGPYRYVAGLTDAQIQHLDSLARQGGSVAILAAGNELLNGAQRTQMQNIMQNQRMATAVTAAEAQVLPMPDELKPKAIVRPTAGMPAPATTMPG